MSLLILGLVLFLGIHTLTTMRAARRGDRPAGRRPLQGPVFAVSAVGLVLIVWGFSRYRSAGYIQVWNPPFSIFHPIALVLLWFALVALAAAYAPPSRIKAILRHPMLVGGQGLGAVPSAGERRSGLDAAVRRPARLGDLRSHRRQATRRSGRRRSQLFGRNDVSSWRSAPWPTPPSSGCTICSSASLPSSPPIAARRCQVIRS